MVKTVDSNDPLFQFYSIMLFSKPLSNFFLQKVVRFLQVLRCCIIAFQNVTAVNATGFSSRSTTIRKNFAA